MECDTIYDLWYTVEQLRNGKWHRQAVTFQACTRTRLSISACTWNESKKIGSVGNELFNRTYLPAVLCVVSKKAYFELLAILSQICDKVITDQSVLALYEFLQRTESGYTKSIHEACVESLNSCVQPHKQIRPGTSRQLQEMWIVVVL